ncbi:hypothetical protein RSAG8_10092, partial [Rhizoctonia solani AG-8 WAC10335]
MFLTYYLFWEGNSNFDARMAFRAAIVLGVPTQFLLPHLLIPRCSTRLQFP